ncbi:nuclear transport factor 2 family protein [Chimaeribacter californicus]|uniref:Nuclear transport factor 2 family protein n=1 Tax=Chimaeribacter californicus TaxID=2060067 RepID=A0A2N5E2E1_9GAMM|nr:nuclear transport factor 2 family protein [Chimaeribacter californicus]PLR34727.1 nuclear transport factor 2 family protein [Chimaeribacter californicus]
MKTHLSELLEFERQRQQALTQPDLVLLEKLLAEDLVHVHSTGMVHNKQQFLKHIERMGGFIAISRETPDIRLEGGFAILTGKTRNTIRLLETGEENVRCGFSTLVLRRTPQSWQILLSQLTPYQS